MGHFGNFYGDVLCVMFPLFILTKDIKMRPSFSLLVLILVLISSCAMFSSDKKDLNKNISLYKAKANELVINIKGKKSFGQIRTMSNELLKLGGLVISGYQEKDKSCKAYLEKVLEAQAKMLTLKLEEIEGQYHEGAALPETDKDLCITAKELVVHPATVVILSRLEDNASNRESMEEELKEVINHVEELK